MFILRLLFQAMENQEEPSVLTLLTDFDTENHGLNVMRIALNYRVRAITQIPPYNYTFIYMHITYTYTYMFLLYHSQPTERPPVRKIEEELEIASRTPTWTNLAYQKYYGK